MTIKHTELLGSYIIEPDIFEDDRGWFSRIYCKEEFESQGLNSTWVQLNHSYTKERGTIRGMHFQVKPFGETKLVKCVSGEVMDVIVDIRKGSQTFLKCFSFRLSEKNKCMIYIPEGFAHGFQTMRDHCELIYFHSEFFNPSHEAGIHYEDPRIDIKWPLLPKNVSAKDLNRPLLNQDFSGI